jgi:AmiR/NasT family two-component response regulator
VAQERADPPVPVPDTDLLEQQASLAALNAQLADARIKIKNLTVALQTSRTIGAAIGILMVQRQIPSDAAFEVLVQHSQRSHDKVHDIAARVVYTGSLTS